MVSEGAGIILTDRPVAKVASQITRFPYLIFAIRVFLSYNAEFNLIGLGVLRGFAYYITCGFKTMYMILNC